MGVRGHQSLIYTKEIMKVRNGSSGRVVEDLSGAKALGRSCPAVSEVQINGIPKPCPQEVASAT
jgi:hypothetical protein